MEILLTMKELLEMRPTLMKISSQDLPISQAVKYAMLFNEIEKYFEVFNEMRDKILKKYNIQSVNFNFENEEIKTHFENDYEELMNFDVVLTDVPTINLESLGDDIKLSILDIMNLKPIL